MLSFLRLPIVALACAVASLALTGCSAVSSSSLSSALSKVKNGSSLTQAEIASGLKEALNVGIKAGVKVLSATNGYYDDLATRIGLPSEATIITKNIAKLPGGQALVTKVIKNINAAASDAASQAIPIFASAVTSMTISDAKKILTSKGQAATDYFKTKTKASLKKLFASYITASVKKKLVGDVSAQSAWDTMTSQWNKVATSTVGKVAGFTSVNTDLVNYLTDKAVDGIYYKVGEQEKKIRTDVSARTTALLKKVFAQQ